MTLVRVTSHGRRGPRRRRRLVWSQLQSQQGAPELFDDEGTSDDDGGGDLVEQMVRRQIREAMRLHLLARALRLEIETLIALLQEALGVDGVDVDGGGGNSWFGAVPASTAAVAALEKQAFHAAAAEGCGGAGVGECAICLEDFEDGDEVSVMPCSHGHGFHSSCITKWLGRSNMCPLCRHELPTGGVDDGQ